MLNISLITVLSFEMNSYHIKINNKFVKNLIETDIPQKFRGEWHNQTIQSCSKFVLTKDKNEAKIIEGNRNLKSNFDIIIHILQDGIYEVKKIEIIKRIKDVERRYV